MTDLLESTDTGTDPATTPGTVPATAASMATSTPFPPPPPNSMAAGADVKRQRILAVVGAIALLAAVVMGLLWVSAQNGRDDVATERDAAQAAATEEAERTTEALDALAAAEVDLEAERTNSEQLAAELAAAEADAAEAAAAAARADEAEATLAAVNVQNAELGAEILALQTALDEAEAAVEAAAEAGAPAPPAAFDINAAPELGQFIGEQLSSSNGPTVLGQGQNRCLGTAVVNDIGLAALGTGLVSGASSSDSAVVIEAIERAAVTCGIDPSAIF